MGLVNFFYAISTQYLHNFFWFGFVQLPSWSFSHLKVSCFDFCLSLTMYKSIDETVRLSVTLFLANISYCKSVIFAVIAVCLLFVFWFWLLGYGLLCQVFFLLVCVFLLLFVVVCLHVCVCFVFVLFLFFTFFIQNHICPF